MLPYYGCSGRTHLGTGMSTTININKTRDNTKPVVLSGAITKDMTLSGKVTVAKDLLIPENITLTLEPDTSVTVVPSDGTRTDAQFVSTETEIVVRGTLSIPGGRVTITSETGIKGSWGGIILATPGSRVKVHGASISDAQYGVLALAGNADISGSSFSANEVGIAAAPEATVKVSDNRFINNDIATAAFHSQSTLVSPTDRLEGNGDDSLALISPRPDIAFLQMIPVVSTRPAITREYFGEMALDEDTTWTGTVVIDGQVAVPEDVTLTIEPGTHVLFSFRDTNSDGLGESWIIVQGTVKVLGEEDEWVLFDSEEKNAGPGAWDSLSIIASDSTDNLIRYALFRHGVKSLHTHFSKVRLEHSVFEDNLRGIQFQESEKTIIDRVYLTRNQSGMRLRDSTVTISNVAAVDNVAGINFLRANVTASDILVSGSLTESFVSRESDTKLKRAVITGNVRGPRFKGEGQTITISEVAIVGNLTEGLSFNNVKGSIRESSLSDNGFTGLSVSDAEVTAYGNRLTGNGRFAIDNNGSTTVDARENDWGTGSKPSPDAIYDAEDEEGIGPVLTDDPRPFALAFPGMPIPSLTPDSSLLIIGDVITQAGKTVTIPPGSSVFFSEVPTDSLFDLRSDHPSFPSSELHVMGEFVAAGTPEKPITFSPARRTLFELTTDNGPGRAQWGSINLTGGQGALFDNCYIFRASTGIHAREAGRVEVKNTVFTSNLVGLRFSRTDMNVHDNVFELNNAGLRFHEFGGLVERNLFDANATAIFVTDNPENVRIVDNKFINSWDYNVKLGINVTDDVVIESGVFEVPVGKVVDDLVFDKKDDPDLGRVIVTP